MANHTTDRIELFLAGQRAFGERVHAVSDEQWRASTPDTEWVVADLVRHLIVEHRWAAPLMHGLDLETAAKVVDSSRTMTVDGGVGGNLAAEWDEAAAESADAFSGADALNRQVALSRGLTPAGDYLDEMIFDLVVHSWDLGQAIGFPEPVPDDIAAPVYRGVSRLGDLSSSGLFDAPVPVPEGAPVLVKLVALTGRDPDWH